MRKDRIALLALAGVAAATVVVGHADSGSASTAHSNTVVYEADYPEYDTLTDAVNASSLIVTGTVVNQHTVEVRPDVSTDTDPVTNPQAGVPASDVAQIPSIVTTVFDVKVGAVLGGNAAVGDVIEVSQLGGTLNGVTYVEKDSPALTPSRPYVLFLAGHGEGNPYDVINPAQGIYTVSGGKFLPANPHGFKGLSRDSVARARH